MKTRKLLAVILASVLVFTLLPLGVFAEESSGSCGENLTWTLDADGTLTISGTGEMEEYDWSESPFYKNDKIKKVVIEEGVTTVSGNAFVECHSLTAVVFPDTLTRIGDNAFYDCKLSIVTIPNGVTEIGMDAFYWCQGLKTITIGAGVASIGNQAFSCCGNLEKVEVASQNPAFCSVDGILFNRDKTELIVYPSQKTDESYTVPAGVTRIHDYAFHENFYLTSVVVSAGVTAIGSSAFSYCENLANIVIPDSVIRLGPNVFDLTAWMDAQPDGIVYVGKAVSNYKGEIPAGTKLTIKDGTVSIADRAFDGCTGLASVTIPESVTEIGEFAFTDCENLKSLTIPSCVTKIGRGAFIGCKSLKSMTIPGSVTEIGDYAFDDCSGLQEVTIPINAAGSELFSDCSALETVILAGSGDMPDWDSMSFYPSYHPSPLAGCDVRAVVIADGITGIGSHAFQDCAALESVTIPASVTRIGASAFMDCESLKSVTIPDGVTEIGTYAFGDCAGLTEVTMPAAVTAGESLFSGCEALETVTLTGSGDMPDWDYQYSDNPSPLAGSDVRTVVITDGITSIGDYAFYHCAALESVMIPAGVTRIGKSAFEACEALAAIDVAPGNPVYHSAGNCLIKTEEKTLIVGCKSSVIPTDGSVTKIGVEAFSECHNLAAIVIPDCVTEIGENAFFAFRVRCGGDGRLQFALVSVLHHLGSSSARRRSTSF